MYRTRQYRRRARAKAINRKKSICSFSGWYYHYEGMLSKGKIHCSCPMCKVKSTRLYGVTTNTATIRSKQLFINDLNAREQIRGE